MHDLDRHIGRRLRARRRALGLTQADLAADVGVTFQQVQKYEQAVTRTSSAMLWKLACALDVGVHYFFDGLGGAAAQHQPRSQAASEVKV